MEDQVFVTFDDPSDMVSFLEFVRLSDDIVLQEEVRIAIVSGLKAGSRLGNLAPSTLEIVVLAVNALSAVGTLLGLYINRAGRKKVTIVHTRTKKRYSISGLSGAEAAAVLQAAALDEANPPIVQKEGTDRVTPIQIHTSDSDEA